jgi:hypothetical protein
VARTVRYEGEKDNNKMGNAEPELVGNPKAPSGGGEGDVKKSIDTVSFRPKTRSLNSFVKTLVYNFAPSMIEALSSVSEDNLAIMKSDIVDYLLDDTIEFGSVLSDALKNKSLGTFEFGDVETELASLLGDGYEHINLKPYADTLKANVKSRVGDFIGRATLVTTMLSEEEPDMLMDDVVAKVTATLPDYIYSFVNIEAKSVVEEIINTPSPLPEAIRMKSLPKPRKEIQAPSITVNVPERDVHVSMPERSAPVVNVSVPAAEPRIDVHVPESTINVNIPEQETPIVHVSPAQVTVNNDIPKQDAPVINVSLPESPAPIVNVDVAPTPVAITNPVTVNIPQETQREQDVQRDRAGNIVHTTTKIIYGDKNDS